MSFTTGSQTFHYYNGAVNVEHLSILRRINDALTEISRKKEYEGQFFFVNVALFEQKAADIFILQVDVGLSDAKNEATIGALVLNGIFHVQEQITFADIYERPNFWPSIVANRVLLKIQNERKERGMVALPPVEQKTVDAIYRHYVTSAGPEFREHLGASIIGHECQRYLWYCFHWASVTEFGGRMLRLFDTGQKEEARFVADLRAIGCTVQDVDPDTGRQWRVSDHGGHFGGSLDAVIIGLLEAPKTPHVGEFKTHNTKSFERLKATGVKASKPMHYAQMQIYMGLKKLTRAFYLAKCKDTDELYSERVEFDEMAFDVLRRKAYNIINSPRPPTPIDQGRGSFICRMCDAKELCLGNKVPESNCRTCEHVRVTVSTPWQCAKHSKMLTLDEQVVGCDDYEASKRITQNQ